MSEIMERLLYPERKSAERIRGLAVESEEFCEKVELVLKKLRDEELLALLLFKYRKYPSPEYSIFTESEFSVRKDSGLLKKLEDYIEKRTVNDLRDNHPLIHTDDKELKECFIRAKEMLGKLTLDQSVKSVQALYERIDQS